MEEGNWTIFRAFYFAYFLMDLGLIQMVLTMVITTSSDKSSGGVVCPWTESAMRLHIGQRSVVELTTSCGGIPIGFFLFEGFLILYMIKLVNPSDNSWLWIVSPYFEYQVIIYYPGRIPVTAMA
jgi:hypothetical protein